MSYNSALSTAAKHVEFYREMNADFLLARRQNSPTSPAKFGAHLASSRGGRGRRPSNNRK